MRHADTAHADFHAESHADPHAFLGIACIRRFLKTANDHGAA